MIKTGFYIFSSISLTASLLYSYYMKSTIIQSVALYASISMICSFLSIVDAAINSKNEKH